MISVTKQTTTSSVRDVSPHSFSFRRAFLIERHVRPNDTNYRHFGSPSFDEIMAPPEMTAAAPVFHLRRSRGACRLLFGPHGDARSVLAALALALAAQDKRSPIWK